MLQVPLQAVPAQVVRAVLDRQEAVITLRQLRTGLYMNLQLGLTEVVGLVICQNLNRIVRNSYLGFAGDFFFYDTLGTNDPTFDGLGDRYQLVYLSESELPS